LLVSQIHHGSTEYPVRLATPLSAGRTIREGLEHVHAVVVKGDDSGVEPVRSILVRLARFDRFLQLPLQLEEDLRGGKTGDQPVPFMWLSGDAGRRTPAVEPNAYRKVKSIDRSIAASNWHSRLLPLPMRDLIGGDAVEDQGRPLVSAAA
jgi:hypothetical protein